LDQIAEDVRLTDQMALHSACYIFSVSMKLIPAALANNMQYIIRRINGGLIGSKERMDYYELCKTYIK
jgi:predicted chitinase